MILIDLEFRLELWIADEIEKDVPISRYPFPTGGLDNRSKALSITNHF